MRYLSKLFSTSLSLLYKSVSTLSSRSLIELQGPDSRSFINGLTTCNALQSLEGKAQYSGLLNSNGRILYDVIIYHMSHDRLWVESDTRAVDDVIKHFTKYRLRSKVDFTKLRDVSVCYKSPNENNNNNNNNNVFISVADPRTSALFDRVLINSNNNDNNNINGEEVYLLHRLQSGVPEGIDEFLINKTLPLEMNMDYMNGVSFDKGCYLGQELTSRTHFRGIVRKRILPITMDEEVEHGLLSWGNEITNSDGKKIGKIIKWKKKYAIALLQLPLLVEGKKIVIKTNEEGRVVEGDWRRPEWWPSEE